MGEEPPEPLERRDGLVVGVEGEPLERRDGLVVGVGESCTEGAMSS